MAKTNKRGAGQLSLWQRIRRNPSQAVFYLLGVLIILSMIISMVVVALPQPAVPAQTPLPLGGAFPWLAVGA
ncbi:MAG: hypothetical protein GX605_01420 [Chloroflexi bacterium]|nr:hypothetical protein [Chloroflexota bacterium]